MEFFQQPDWQTMFVPSKPLLETAIRGSFVYLGLFLLLRIVLKRQSGDMGVTDLLVIVLIAEASQNAMGGDYRSIPDGLLLVMTIIFWSYVLDWLGYHFPALGKLIYPPPLKLIESGKLLYRNLRKELISREELDSQLRGQGIKDIAEVESAYMEGDGRISVVKKDKPASPKPKRKRS